jgi:mono/diheme cytochrome c family protein
MVKWFFILAALCVGAPIVRAEEKRIDFVRDVQPIFQKSCVECHSADNKKGRLRLDAKKLAFAGGQSGAIITPGNAKDSTLIRRVTGAGGEKQMPFKRTPLPDEQIRILTAWIEQGAAWPDGVDGAFKEDKVHWSFVKPVHRDAPSVKNASWVRNPIDAFILARLEKEGLKPSPEAEKFELIRRVTLDLIGLPPTPEQVDTFLLDTSPDAYEKLVDRLLASPHYGERWARIWLDAARFADTNGYEKDRPRNIWPYRDWVINALNRDEPFNQFTIEQIAGDMLPNATPEQIIATGFHRNTLWNEEGGVDLEEFRFKSIVDRIETTSKVWLGLTLQCAQCHNHKYDPVTQKEYYGLFAMLNNADEPEYEIPNSEIASKRAAIEAQIAAMEANLEKEFPAEEPATEWTILQPAKLAATSGATLAASQDGAVTASGTAAATDSYTFQVGGDFEGATAIRLEALTDSSLPHGGPGRAANGNFVLSEFKVATINGKGKKAKPVDLRFSAAAADVSQDGFDVIRAVDGDAGTGWAIDDRSGKLNQNRTATFQFAEPMPANTKMLRFTLEQNLSNHALGKFRVSVGRPKGSSGNSVAKTSTTRLAEKLAEWQQQTAPKAGHWTIVRPEKMTSRGRATMEVQEDGSVVVSGDCPNNDIYTLEIPTPLSGITAIKLEAMPDHSLPEEGPGRAPLFMPGDFMLSEFEVKAGPMSAAELAPVKPIRATQSFASADRSAQAALDGRIDTGWSIGPKTGQTHQAVFVLPAPVGGSDGTKLEVRLVHQYIHQTTLGRFRISVTTDANPSNATTLPADVEAIFASTKPESRSAEQNQRLKQYFLTDVSPDLAAQRNRIAEVRKSMPQYQRTLMMRERAPQHARVTHLLHRGEFLQPREVVSPAVPSAVLHALPPGAPANRLGLAKWLVDENSPLVGRVVMNRAWATFFGRGIVNTIEDFGLMGEPPAHPELLDWLATEFPKRGWSVKAMHRLIVTSATYRQSGRVTPELFSRDPQNVLLARGPRNRVEAEMVRDLALAVSGLLSDKVGGPSVFPPQPDGVTEQSYGKVPWPTSTGADRFRRGLYTYLKRTSPYPAMLTFDAPTGDFSCVRRVKSNTPLQALTLLNDQVFVEASQALARRLLKDLPSEDANARMKRLFRLCTGRDAAADELSALTTFLDAQLSRFKTGNADAAAVAASEALPAPKDANLAELAAWTVVARAMLNLDETITK